MSAANDLNDRLPRLLTADDLAQILSLSIRKIRKMDAAGELPPRINVGSRVRWRETDINEFIRVGCRIDQFDAARKQKEAA